MELAELIIERAKKPAFETAYLKKKYDWTGGKYQELISKIAKENNTKIANEVVARDERKFQKNLKDIQPKGKQKKIILPDLKSVVRNNPAILKAAQNGKLLSEGLRDRLRIQIKSVMLEQGITNKNGTVKKNLSGKVQKAITKTFESYTKNDPSIGMPKNLKSIAVTETRFVVNNVRQEYVKRINTQTSEDYRTMKTWQHNSSKSPREWHERLNGKQVEFDKTFVYKNQNGVTIKAMIPHSADLPASEVINCHCEISYSWIKKQNSK